MNLVEFPYETFLLNMREGQEEIILINGKPFLISLATESDVERVSKGFFVMD
jgi:hypothetical protein